MPARSGRVDSKKFLGFSCTRTIIQVTFLSKSLPEVNLLKANRRECPLSLCYYTIIFVISHYIPSLLSHYIHFYLIISISIPLSLLLSHYILYYPIISIIIPLSPLLSIIPSAVIPLSHIPPMPNTG